MGARNTYRWQQLRLHVLATHPPFCTYHRCPNPRQPFIPGHRRFGPSVDHIHELADGGPMWDPTNLTPVHAGCNATKSNYSRQARAHKASLNPSRKW